MKTVVAWATAAVAGLVLLAACGGGEWPPVDEWPPVVETEEPTGTTPEPERPDVPPLECFSLLTDDEIEEALGERGLFGRGQGEVCTKQLAADERFFVRTEPGVPGDLEPGAELLGVPGEPVSAVGDDARWFGGTGAEDGGTVGILSVRQSTSLGALHFRIALGHPELSNTEQLDIAKELALGALPRFPGVEQPEPEVVTFEREQVDRSNASFVDNLLEKELEGEWTRGEGLVATLSFFAEEVEAAQVLRQPELLDYSGTGAIRMAREYLEDGPDAEAKTEIARLLDRLVFSNDQLEAMAQPAPVSGDASQLAPGAARGPVEDCRKFFDEDVPAGVGQCLEVGISDFLEDFYTGEYRVFFPAPSLPAAGWKEKHFALALEAMEKTVPVYKKLGKLPPVNLVFSVAQGGDAWAAAWPTVGEPCGVAVYTEMQGFEDGDFKQIIAHELGHCFQEETFPEQNQVDFEIVEWREEGLAEYLSNVAYTTNNLEWEELETLEQVELQTTLLDRSYENFIWFQHLANSIGHDDLFALIKALPKDKKSGRGDQEDALAAYGGIEPLLHTFAQGLTDEDIPDSGGGPAPYEVPDHTVAISGPIGVVDDPLRFGVVRLHLVVDPGKYACVEYAEEGELRSSWRTGKPGKPGGSWSNDLPESLQGEAVFVVTTTEEGAAFTVTVTDVDDDPECEDEEDETEPEPCPIEIGCPPSEYYFKDG